LVSSRIRVPRPAASNTALLIFAINYKVTQPSPFASASERLALPFHHDKLGQVSLLDQFAHHPNPDENLNLCKNGHDQPRKALNLEAIDSARLSRDYFPYDLISHPLTQKIEHRDE
jgi:hypothetical protein